MVYWYYGTTREGNKNDAVSIRGRLHRSRENGKQKLRDGGGSDRCRSCKGGGRENLREITIVDSYTTVLWYTVGTLSTEKGIDMCKPVYAIDTPAGRIGIFEGDESEDFHGIRIFWIDENDAVIDLSIMV